MKPDIIIISKKQEKLLDKKYGKGSTKKMLDNALGKTVNPVGSMRKHKIGKHGAVGFLTQQGRVCAECEKPIKEPKPKTIPIERSIEKQLDSIQIDVWAKINETLQKRGVKYSIGDAYAAGSSIKEVLHPRIKQLFKEILPKEKHCYEGCHCIDEILKRLGS